jgi:hypothetical protein
MALIMTAFVFFSCASKKPLPEEAPIITSATYQYTQYNGRNQAVEVVAAKGNVSPFIITYFTSEADLEQDRNSSSEAPAEVGDYFARIERPEGNGYRRGNPITIEYHIQKAFISIVAEPFQRFAYDGEPKEVTAHTEPPVEPPLSFSYAAAGDPAAHARTDPPSGRGHYLVTVVFPGNDRYMGASREIVLQIE